MKYLYSLNKITRSDTFLQTKFTPQDGHLSGTEPYDINASIDEQVIQSFNSSISNLATNYLDALLLHSPMGTFADTLQVWRAFETLHDLGLARRLGISNVNDLATLRRLFASARIKPSILQNRFNNPLHSLIKSSKR